MKNLPIISFIFFLVFACQGPSVEKPQPVMPVPSERQLKWQDMEYYAFIHFNMNTFSNMEWGLGDEDPKQFNPTGLDTRQWAKVAKEAGMKGIILTAKHHDGFCLWPTETTEHSVKNSLWKDGKGDVIKELSGACREYGLKFGVYLSPWDRNHKDYGRPEYIQVFRAQLRELLTNYGDVFEVWFDGANGGTGYYGGANEERRVDKRNYYDWENTFEIIRELQPDAVIFGDAGPDVRWVGNEHGFAYETTWSNLMRDSVYAGMPEYSGKYSRGQENGTHWVPAEADVSIRPGWYYHEYEDHKVKSLPQLLDIYYQSIGRNSSLLLNFPVDKRGLIHENDVQQLRKLTAKIKEDFADNLATEDLRITASHDRGRGFDAKNVVDGNPETYWSTQDGVISASLTLEFSEPASFNRFLVQEHIALGQRVKAFTLEARIGEDWAEIANETTIGFKRILRLPDVEASAIRFTVKGSKASPCISNLELYFAPKLLESPFIHRTVEGMVTLEVPEEGLELYYSLDGTDPDAASVLYEGSFEVLRPVTVKAVAVDPSNNKSSEVSIVELDIAKAKWKVIGGDENASRAIDEDRQSNYTGKDNQLVIDLGEKQSINGFTYMPVQNRYMSGVIRFYTFAVSEDGANWKKVSEGEFGNIANSPIEQRITFDKQEARFIRLTAEKTLDGNPASFAEVGVLSR